MLDALRRVVARIPKGKVATYGAVAAAAGYSGAARQVAWALHNHSAGLPWHRVLGAGGRIRLPGEAGFEQRMRLRQEGVTFTGGRVDMARHEAKLQRGAVGSPATPASPAEPGASRSPLRPTRRRE